MYITTNEFQQIISDKTMRLQNVFRRAGYEKRIVGGAIRDSLIGRIPKDVDFATDATPEEMVRILLEENIYIVGVSDKIANGIPVDKIKFDQIPGYSHGTITAVIGKECFEITTLRVDIDPDGRHAKTKFIKSFEEDAARRDLRFNAMSATLDGKLYDYFGGYDDLMNGIVRFVGDAEKRIEEDQLRQLRYFRFLAQFGFQSDENANAAIRKHSSKLRGISGERRWLEMSKLLSANNPVPYIEMMQEYGVTDAIDLPVNTDRLRFVSTYTTDPVVRLASMMEAHDVDVVTSAWKMKSADRNMMYFLTSNRDVCDLKSAMNFLADGVSIEYVTKLLQSSGQVEYADMMKTWDIPKFPVTGSDLMEMGYKQGPQLGKTLSELRSRWKDSHFSMSRSDLLQLV